MIRWHLVILYACTLVPLLTADISQPTIFYEQTVVTYYPLKTEESGNVDQVDYGDNINLQNETEVQFQNKRIFRRIGMRSNGCNCIDLVCGCCFGMTMQQFNFKREGCMNLTYDPHAFSIGVKMMWNEKQIYENSVSAKNPPPLCIPIPIPYLPSVDICMKLFDIYTPGRNLHACLDVETRVERAQVFILHFNCMRMGSDGVALVKPEDMGGLPPAGNPSGGSPSGGNPLLGAPSTTEVSQIDSDVYDEVTEVKYKRTTKRPR